MSHRSSLTYRALPRLGVGVAALLIAYATLRPWGGALGTLCVRCGDTWLVDALLNIVLFLPLGFALRAAGATSIRALGISATLSLLIEVLQFTLVSGRFTSPIDVLTNSLGGLLGAFGTSWMAAWLQRDDQPVPVAGIFAALWWAQCFVTAWALLPRIPDGTSFEGHWARVPPGFVAFSGRVLDARLWSVGIPDGPVPDSGVIRSLVADSTIKFTVLTDGLPKAEPTAFVAALVSGSDHRLVSLRLAGCSLQARSGTNSERIGLNTPRISVEEACLALPAEATVLVRQDGKHFSLERSSPGVRTVGASLALRPDVGWVMLAPLITSDRERQFLTFAWIALFAFPVGLFAARWGCKLARSGSFSLILVTGTIMPALLFHTAFPTVAELALMVGSVIAGATVASAIPTCPLRPATR